MRFLDRLRTCVVKEGRDHGAGKPEKPADLKLRTFLTVIQVCARTVPDHDTKLCILIGQKFVILIGSYMCDFPKRTNRTPKWNIFLVKYVIFVWFPFHSDWYLSNDCMNCRSLFTFIKFYFCGVGSSGCGFMGCDTVWPCKRIAAFRRNMMPPSSRLKIPSLT